MAVQRALDRHHAGLDGIRALAVAAVLAYHGRVLGLQGGFLGISQFFTLSGFLITSILLRSSTLAGTAGTDLRGFWARRYRRLLPASFLTLGLVVLFGATVATAVQLETLPGEVAAAALQVANWYFILGDQSYVSLFSDPSPVQHFWSLAIEEQFYLLLPVALLVLRRHCRVRTMVAILGAAALASAVLMLVLYRGGASLDRLYYGTDTRAAELLTGAVLAAVIHARPLRFGRTARRTVATLSVLALATTFWGWSAVELTDALLWQGGFILFSLLTVVLVLDVLGGQGPVATALAWSPIAAMGRISYGLYLFHWPIFLWLTEARTNLDTWPLFALRLAVTFTVAIASFHLLEMPIRERRWPSTPGVLRWAVAPTAACLVLGALVVAQREAPADLAGLGEEIDSAPIVVAGGGEFHVLVITDERGEGPATQLADLAGSGTDMRVTVAPFGCSAIDTMAVQPTCANWIADWPAMVDAAEPDVVLFNVTDWPREQVADLAGTTDNVELTSFVTGALEGAFDLLTADGATVVWGTQPGDLGESIRLRNGPFFKAAQALTSARADARRLNAYADDPRATLAELRLYRPRDDLGAPRVLVVGDSTARAVGYGLERWADRVGSATVWSAGTEGCGLVTVGQVRDPAGRAIPVSAECRSVADGWARQIDEFDPDLVIVSSSVFDFPARRVRGWADFQRPGDPQFDELLTETYIEAVDVLTARGAQLVWLQSPCAKPLIGSLGDPNTLDLDRIQHVNDVVLGAVVDARPQVRIFDLFKILCPDGEPLQSVDDVGVLRPDGVHLGSEGSLWLAETYGEEILALGLEAR